MVSSFILSLFKLFCYIFRNNYRVYSKRLLNTSTVAYATSIESGAKGEGLVIRPRSNLRFTWLNCYSLVAIANQKNHQLAVFFFRSVQTSNPDLLTFFTLKNEQ